MTINETIAKISVTGENVDLLKRYLAKKQINKKQFDAAVKFLKIRQDYRLSLLSMADFYEATNIKIGGDNMLEFSEWVGKSRIAYSSVLQKIQHRQFNSPNENLYAPIQYILIDGKDLKEHFTFMPSLLSQLAEHFKTAERASQ